VEVVLGGLGPGRADEHVALTPLLHEVLEAVLDGLVEVTDGGEAGRVGNLLAPVVGGLQGAGGGDGDLGLEINLRIEGDGVLHLYVLGPLEIHEPGEGDVVEPVQVDGDASRVVRRRLGEVRAPQVGGGADGSQQVRHQGQVQHLLLGHLLDRLAPARDRPDLVGAQPLVLLLLAREGGEEVAAAEPVLELGGLIQQGDELLPRFGAQRGSSRHPRGLPRKCAS